MAALLDIVKKGSTDRSVTIRIIDSSDGTPETGVVWNTSGIDLWYRREGSAVVSITEATLSALTDAHSDGGFLHVSHGEYRFDIPDAAFATGENHVDIGGTVTDMVVIGGRVRLVDYDPEDAVRLGQTALPNAAADAAGGLPISDAGGLDLDTISTDIATAKTQIGTAGDGLTDLGGMSTGMKAEVQAEADASLASYDGPTNSELEARTIAAAAYFDPAADTVANVTTVATTTTNSDMRGTDSAATATALATAQTDLDTLTGSDGATLATTQGNYAPLKPTTAGRTLDVTSGGAAGIDWSNIENPTTSVDLSGTDIQLCDTVTTNTDAITVAGILTTQITEAYAADGASPTVAQALCMIQQLLGEFAISGTTLTMKKIDGSTTAGTFTLDDGTSPTSITRAT